MSSAKPTRSGLLGIIDHVKTKDAHAFRGGVASMWRRNVISGTRDWEADAVEVAERTAWASCLLKGHTPRSKAYASAVSPVRNSAPVRWGHTGSAIRVGLRPVTRS